MGVSIINEKVARYFIKPEGNDLHEQVRSYFLSFSDIGVLNHTLDVVSEVCKIADHLDLNKEKCIIAAYLHDIGRVVEKEAYLYLNNGMGF